MAKTGETRLEMRARKLGDAVSRRVDVVATSLKPAGQRPSFTTLMGKTDLFNFVLKNVYGPQGQTPAGQQYMAGLDKQDADNNRPVGASQLELHAALSQHIESQGLMGASPGGAQTMAAGPMGGPNAAV